MIEHGMVYLVFVGKSKSLIKVKNLAVNCLLYGLVSIADIT